jgi:hypothetical protein
MNNQLWTVEPGRGVCFRGKLQVTISRDIGQATPVVADRLVHYLAGKLNEDGATPASLYREAMGYPADRVVRGVED